MPKQKTKKAASKRFKITKTGKIMRGRQNARHLRLNKSKSQKRRYKKSATVSGKFGKMIKNMLSY